MARRLFLISAVMGPILAATSVSLGDIKSLSASPFYGTTSYHGGDDGVNLYDHHFPASTTLPFADTVGNGTTMSSLLTVGKHGVSMVDDFKPRAEVESNACVFFKIDGKSTYSLSGYLTINAPSTASFNLTQVVWVLDETTMQTIYEEWDSGRVKGSTTWKIGTDDSGFGFPGPSLTGLLTDSTHIYSLLWGVTVKPLNGYLNATAHSDMRFDIASVPAPGAALLGFIGLGLTARIRRRLSA